MCVLPGLNLAWSLIPTSPINQSSVHLGLAVGSELRGVPGICGKVRACGQSSAFFSRPSPLSQFWTTFKIQCLESLVVHTCNLDTWKAEAGGLPELMASWNYIARHCLKNKRKQGLRI